MKRRLWLGLGAGLLALLAALGGIAWILALRAEPYLRARLIESLQDHFHARVELDSFHLTLGNGLRGEWGIWAEGKGLRIWPPAQVAGISVPADSTPVAPKPAAAKPTAGKAVGTIQPAPRQTVNIAPPRPLIELAEFRFHAPFRYQPGKPVHIALVELNGITVDLPPRSHFSHPAKLAAEKANKGEWQFQIDEINCRQVHWTIETDKPGKLPQSFDASRAQVTGLTSDLAFHFAAELKIPRPAGEVRTSGSVGGHGSGRVGGEWRVCAESCRPCRL
jgi:hypothetical protein